MAQAMRRESKIATATIGFIARPQDMPKWGQLGCNGFIVLDSELQVVARRTSAFLEVRALAFSHVEALLQSLVAGRDLPAVCPGQVARLTGLQQTAFNGKPALCLRAADQETPRYLVQLLDATRKQLSVKPENLTLVENDDEEEKHASKGGAEGGG
jgi:hypothetical protein